MSIESQRPNIEQAIVAHAGLELADAWRKYVEIFGQPPHGTARQLAALLEFCPVLRGAIVNTFSDWGKNLADRAAATYELSEQNKRDCSGSTGNEPIVPRPDNG